MNGIAAKDSGWDLRSANASHAKSEASSASPAPAAREAASSSCSKGTVLIVEDDQAARKAIRQILKRAGFVVSEASTVAEAMQGLANIPRWILLDLMLPDGCGLKVLRRVQSDHLATKVCIVTGCGPEKLEEARKAGAEHAFTKPVDFEHLMNLLSS